MKNHLTGRVSTTIEAPAEKVWAALTRSEMIKQYFFGTDAHTSWQPGTPIRFTGEWQGKQYEDKGTVLAFEPSKLLRYTYWSSMGGMEDKPENYATVTYELQPLNDAVTELTIIQENIPDEKMRQHSEGNWAKVLEQLKELLEKEKTAYGSFFL